MSDSDLIIGQRIRHCRTERKVTTRVVADRMRDHGHDWHHNTVLRTEAGKRPLRVAEAFALATVLQMPVAEILGLVGGDADTQAAIQSAARRQLGYELLDSLRKENVSGSALHWRGDEIPIHTTDQVELWLIEYLSRDDEREDSES